MSDADPKVASEQMLVDVESYRRLQADLRHTQEREMALVAERASLTERLERQAKWLQWPQYNEIGASAALRRALFEACGIGLSWSGSDTASGRRLRELHDLGTLTNGELAAKEAERD